MSSLDVILKNIQVDMKTHREVNLNYGEVKKPNEDPGNQGDDGYDDDEGHKVATDLICVLLDGGLEAEESEFRHLNCVIRKTGRCSADNQTQNSPLKSVPPRRV